jgi:hypothetical protein
MMIRNFNEHAAGINSDVHVWHCGGCERFHVRAGSVLLSFRTEEFAAFTETVVDCFTANQKPIDLLSRPEIAVVEVQSFDHAEGGFTN